jgi:hypothetical protein
MGTRLQRFATEEEVKRALEKAQHGSIVPPDVEAPPSSSAFLSPKRTLQREE